MCRSSVSTATPLAFQDTSTSATPTGSNVFIGGTGGTNPPFPAHGIFNQTGPIYWQAFSLGNFAGNSAKIADFNDDFVLGDGPADNQTGEIYAYAVTATRAMSLHFDLWGFKSNGNLVKAPFSHDAIVTHRLMTILIPAHCRHLNPPRSRCSLWAAWARRLWSATEQ